MIERIGIGTVGALLASLIWGFFYFTAQAQIGFGQGQMSVIQAVCPQVVQAVMQSQQQQQAKQPAEAAGVKK